MFVNSKTVENNFNTIKKIIHDTPLLPDEKVPISELSLHVEYPGENLKVCIDYKNHKKKPSDFENKRMSYVMGHQVFELTPEELACGLTAPHSRTFTPAIFKMIEGEIRRKNIHFKSQQYFGLDFDETISLDIVLKRCEQYDIHPVFSYNTFSDKNLNRFRVIFLLNIHVKNYQIRELIQKSLVTIFPESDTKCKDASRALHGGKKILYEDYDSRLDIATLIKAVCFYFRDKDPTNSSKKIKSYCGNVGLNMINGNPYVQELDNVDEVQKLSPLNITKKSTILYIYYRNVEKLVKNNMLQKFIIVHISNKATHTQQDTEVSCRGGRSKKSKKTKYDIDNIKFKRDKFPHTNWDEVSDKCKLYKGFISGEYRPDHDELFGLLLNLLILEGGEKKFKEGLQKRTGSDIDKWNNQIYYCKKSDYKPENCKNYCSFKHQCDHDKNMVATVKIFRGTIKIKNPHQFKSLSQAEQELEQCYNKVISSGSSDDHTVNTIKAVTGIGKSRLYENIKKAIIAVPTHDLKDEMAERMLKTGNEVLVTPRLPKLPKEIKKQLEYFYAIGAYKMANIFLAKLAKKPGYESLKKYINTMKNILRSNKTVITTHQRMLHFSDTEREILIIDEDPFQVLLKQGYIYLEDLLIFRDIIEGPFEIDFDNLINVINSLDYEKPQEMPFWFDSFIDDFEKKYAESIINKKIKTNILGFLYCSHFIKSREDDRVRINFIQKHQLPDKKTIIFSATADESIYEKLFGDRLNFMDIGLVESKGELIQYPARSFSRYQLDHDPDLFGLALDISKQGPVITYKHMEESFENCIATFGATMGLDRFGGMDMTILGTPNMPPLIYYLYAYALGFTVENSAETLQYIPVQHNGFEFFFNTYSENIDLRKIQFYLIESELVQAVGRARLLRNDCTVSVYSNYPLQGATFSDMPGKSVDTAA